MPKNLKKENSHISRLEDQTTQHQEEGEKSVDAPPIKQKKIQMEGRNLSEVSGSPRKIARRRGGGKILGRMADAAASSRFGVTWERIPSHFKLNESGRRALCVFGNGEGEGRCPAAIRRGVGTEGGFGTGFKHLQEGMS